MDYMTQIHQRLQDFSYQNTEGQREWTSTKCEMFRQWLMKFLRRNPKARNAMINAPKKWNNTTQVLEHFSKHFVVTVGFKIK
jgi:hypothetical protein